MSLADIPPLVLAAALAPLLPVAVLLWQRPGTPARRWLLVACLLSLLIDAVMLALALERRNNHWVSYLLTPFFGAALLLCLAHWQRTAVGRTALQLAAGLLLVAAALLTLLVEDPTSYSRYASPVRALLVLLAALWTGLQQLLGRQGGGFWRAGRVWAPMGLALYSAVSGAYFPLANWLADREPGLVMLGLQLKSALVVAAFCLVAWGVWWTIPARSGASSSSSS